MNRFLIFLIMFTFSSAAFAELYYRHLPFELSIDRQDTIIVDYNFAAKAGIICRASDRSTLVKFQYKGRQKQSRLPAILENSFVPKHAAEHLADIKGQFKIAAAEAEDCSENKVSIQCHYLTAEYARR